MFVSRAIWYFFFGVAINPPVMYMKRMLRLYKGTTEITSYDKSHWAKGEFTHFISFNFTFTHSRFSGPTRFHSHASATVVSNYRVLRGFARTLHISSFGTDSRPPSTTDYPLIAHYSIRSTTVMNQKEAAAGMWGFTINYFSLAAPWLLLIVLVLAFDTRRNEQVCSVFWGPGSWVL